MRRQIDLNEISDGRVYTENDMVKADCQGCRGCSKCCGGMDDTITLDPYDLNRLYKGLNTSFEGLYSKGIGLTVQNGIIVPHIMMDKETDRCMFIGEDGWCTIHKFRSAMCRLFPLARVYEAGDVKYALLKDVCDMPHSKVKVSKWLDQEDYPRYKEFIIKWHDFLKSLEAEKPGNELNMKLIQTFYVMPFGDDFYTEVYERMDAFMTN